MAARPALTPGHLSAPLLRAPSSLTAEQAASLFRTGQAASRPYIPGSGRSLYEYAA